VTAGSVVVATTTLAGGDSALGAGFIAFVVVVALCVASGLLFRSMNRHLKGLPTRFPPAPTPEVAPDGEPSAPSGQTPAETRAQTPAETPAQPEP
jgi:hypothetical protein